MFFISSSRVLWLYICICHTLVCLADEAQIESLESISIDVQPHWNSSSSESHTRGYNNGSVSLTNGTDVNELEADGSDEESEYYYEYYYDDETEENSNQTSEEALPEAQPWISQGSKKGDDGRLLGANVNFGTFGGKDVVWLSDIRSNISFDGTQFQTMAALGNAALILGSALGVGLYPISQRRSLERATFRAPRRPPFPFYPPRRPFVPRSRARRPPQLRRRRPSKGRGRGLRRKKVSRRRPGRRPKPTRLPTFSLSKPTPKSRPLKPIGTRKPEFTYRRQKPKTKRPRISAKPSITNEKFVKNPSLNLAVVPKEVGSRPKHPFTKAHGYAPILPPGDDESNNYVEGFSTTKNPKDDQPTLYREDILQHKNKGSSHGSQVLDSPNDFLKDLDEPEFDGVRLRNPFRTDFGGSPFNLDPFRELKIIVNGDKGSTEAQGNRQPKRRIAAQSRAIKSDEANDQSLAQSQKQLSFVDPFKNAQAVHVIKKAEELNLFLSVQDVDVPVGPQVKDPVLKELRSQLPLYPPTRILDQERELGIASVKRRIQRKGQSDPPISVPSKSNSRPIYLEDLYDYHDSEANDSFKIELTERPVQTLPPSDSHLSDETMYEDDQSLLAEEFKNFEDFKRINVTLSPETSTSSSTSRSKSSRHVS